MHTLVGQSFLVKADADPVEVCVFNGVVSSFVEPTRRFRRTDAGWVDDDGDRVEEGLASELSNLLLPEEGNNTPLYGTSPSPLTGVPEGETQFVLEDSLAHEHGPGTHEH